MFGVNVRQPRGDIAQHVDRTVHQIGWQQQHALGDIVDARGAQLVDQCLAFLGQPYDLVAPIESILPTTP